MSKKKEKRIKRLRKSSIWPQIIETFLVELAFITAILIVLLVDFSTETHDLVINNAETCKTIVEYVNTDWDSESKSLSLDAQTEFSNILKYDYETITAINIVDDDFNVLASFGDKNINDSSYEEHFDRALFDKNGLYLTEEASDYEVINEDNGDNQKSFFWFTKKDLKVLRLFSKHFESTFDSFNDKESYAWATTNESHYTMWIMYKTAIPGINAAIEKRSIRTMLEMGRFIFLLVILVGVFLFIWLYEHYKLVSIILQRRKIKKLIYTDSITGGMNKDAFVERAAKCIKRRRRRYAIVYLRMEKYRNFVTAYGIKEGENLMEDFNKLLCSMIKKRKELTAHLEKGDFALLLHFDNEDLLNIRMRSIAQALNDSRPKQHLTFAIGACRIISRYDLIEEKLSNAGAAISKIENASTSVFWFDESMREEQIWERRVEDDMERALADNEFKVYLQPKYSTKKEELSAAEALVRWVHPEYGFVSPARFIPIFERNGFITKLDDYMLTEVSKLQAKWLADGKKLVPISVNVSRAHFSQYDLAEHIRAIVDEYKVPHEFIELELTESAFFDDKQVLLDTIKKLKEYGFKVSMDDFGAGYSSLNSLKELPLDIIKLDAQFFRDIEDKKRADLIVCDTIKLAKKLGMQIVAEGIETREQVDFLANQHCDLIQGFYFAKPLPVNEFEERAFSLEEKTSKRDKA